MKTVWMTLPDCVRVAKGVFEDTATLYFRDLIATVESQARAISCEGGKKQGLGACRQSLIAWFNTRERSPWVPNGAGCDGFAT